jgi:hypothetical protein
MSKTYKTSERVQWSWGTGTGEGTVKERFTTRVTRTIKGSEITRNADKDNPAYLIEQDDGDLVLKSHSELEKV